MSQARTKGTTFKKVMSHPVFIEGYKDAMNGVGLYEKYDRLGEHQRFSYERGRQFFFATGKKMRIRQGKGVDRDALSVFKWLFVEKAII